jgi:hypothetical protein
VNCSNQLFSTKYFQHHYIAPHTRAATYIIGLGLGYSIHKTRGKKIPISYPFVVTLWTISVATMLAALVGCHAFHKENHEYNRLEASVFHSCSRSAWTFGIVWMVWACINGYGGTSISESFVRFVAVSGFRTDKLRAVVLCVPRADQNKLFDVSSAHVDAIFNEWGGENARIFL